jgi:hypothetical protein
VVSGEENHAKKDCRSYSRRFDLIDPAKCANSCSRLVLLPELDLTAPLSNFNF